MPICPNCKQIIDFVRETCSGYNKSELFFNKKEGWIDWRNTEFEGDGVLLEYSCPKCEGEILLHEEEIEKFLKDTDELREVVAEKLNKIHGIKKS